MCATHGWRKHIRKWRKHIRKWRKHIGCGCAILSGATTVLRLRHRGWRKHRQFVDARPAYSVGFVAALHHSDEAPVLELLQSPHRCSPRSSERRLHVRDPHGTLTGIRVALLRDRDERERLRL